MPSIPGAKADVFFGPTEDLPDWREHMADEDDEDRELTAGERKAITSILGFDPAELDDPEAIVATDAVKFDEGSTPTSTLDELTAIGTAAARARIKTAAERIAELTKKKSEVTTFEGLGKFDLLAGIREIINELHSGISSDLSASMMAATFGGAAEVAVSIPPLAYVPPAASGGDVPPGEPPMPAPSFFPDPEPGALRFPVLDEAVRILDDARIFTSDDYREVAEQARAGAFAITSTMGEEAVADVRDILARNLEKGPDMEAFVEEVTARLEEGGPLSERHIETIFRTNVSSAFSNGSHKALAAPMVADAFPYRAYFATTDQRVREEHMALETAGLNGTNVYRADDPTWLKFRPPWDFNCRCAWSPASVEQASRLGVQEAIDWLARAKQAAEDRGGTWPEWLAATAPERGEWVQSPGFEPPAEFRRL